MKSKLAVFSGGASAFTFAVLLGHAALHPELAVFEGFTWPRLVLTLLFVGTCVAYWVWLLDSERAQKPEAATFVRAVLPGWPLLAAAAISAPISSDPMLYLHYGAMALGGVNPYLSTSDSVTSPFSSSVVWYQTSAYGPIALTLFALAALAQSPIWGVAILKLLWLCAHLLSAYACWWVNTERRTWLTRAFAFNPILLLAFVVDVHVDVLTTALLLWGLVALAKDRARLALVVLVAAALTKSVALHAVPLWLAWALSRRRWALSLFGIAFSGAVVVLLWSTLLPNGAAWRSLVNPVPNTGRSIQHALVLSGPSFGFEGARAAAFYGWVARGAFVLGAGVLWLRAVRARPYPTFTLARDFALLLLSALLFVVPFVPWWYSALVLATALWCPSAAPLRPSAMAYGACTALTLSAGSGLSHAGLVSTALAIVPATALLLWSVWLARREAAPEGRAWRRWNPIRAAVGSLKLLARR